MSVRMMIIDAQAEFRTLLMHHVTTHWPEARITAYDPIEAGSLPDDFSGAGNEIVLLGNALGDSDGMSLLTRLVNTPGFPPVVYFGGEGDRAAAGKAGAAAFFPRTAIRHSAFAVRVSDILSQRQLAASTDSLFVGDLRTGISPLIRGYRYIRKLGATERSSVYLAERESTHGRVVLKVLRQIPDPSDSVGAFDRFLQEFELIAELEHPNIVRIHDLGVSDDHAHIAMEYLDGGDLKQRIATRMTPATAVHYFRQMVSAIAEIHSVGILHRDLKPANIMLRADDSIALIDFGLAKRMRLEMAMTGSGEIFGTPYYMSPEQGHGNGVDARSDIYSLGIIFFEMLTGEKPYTADTAMGIIFKHARVPVPLLPPRLAQYQAVLNMMLAKRPEDRLQSAAEILEWL
jgi:serine/threonine protein kinase